MRLVYALLLTAALAACTTEAEHKRIVEAWVGSSEASLVSSSWGAPNRVYTTGDGAHVLTYSDARAMTWTSPSSAYRNYNYATHTFHMSCQTTFTVEDGIITRVAYRGNDCRL